MFIFEMKRYLDKEQFDVVHFNSSNSLLGAVGAKISIKKTKTIFTFHGLSTLDSEYSNIFSRIIYWIIFKFLLIFINKNIFVSNNNLKKAKKIKLIKSGYLIYNGIDNEQIKLIDKNQILKEVENITGHDLQNKYIIGSIGRLTKQKNYEFLIKVFPKILSIEPNAICIIIGDGPLKFKLQNLIIQLHLSNKIFLIGEKENASKYLSLLNIFILPSIYEGLPISLTETLFAKIPAIASNVGGNKEVIGENFTYPLNNEEEFLKLFVEVFSNKIYQDFSKQKLPFSITSMIANIQKIYSK
jgi:glycosyltransferase involved in cell wall biosynthesis